jgi:hypothetical protein
MKFLPALFNIFVIAMTFAKSVVIYYRKEINENTSYKSDLG